MARVELDDHVSIEHYPDVPPLGNTALEIQLIEVHKDGRRQAIATEVVRLLACANPRRRLVALAKRRISFGTRWAGAAMSIPKARFVCVRCTFTSTDALPISDLGSAFWASPRAAEKFCAAARSDLCRSGKRRQARSRDCCCNLPTSLRPVTPHVG